jgi:uncharacterized OB-fold protein
MTSAPSEHRRPTPVLTIDNEFFWRGAAEGELLIQGCGQCGALAHPPTPLCPECHSSNRTTKVMSGRGQVSSYMIVHHPPNPWFEMPIAVVQVELDEGPHLTSNIVDVALDDIDIGLVVEVLFAETEDPEVGVPIFRPVGGER